MDWIDENTPDEIKAFHSEMERYDKSIDTMQEMIKRWMKELLGSDYDSRDFPYSKAYQSVVWSLLVMHRLMDAERGRAEDFAKRNEFGTGWLVDIHGEEIRELIND